MERISDPWIEQEEVRGRFSDLSSWNGDWVEVYKREDSYVEHFLGMLVPVPYRWAKRTMRDLSWDRDCDHSKGRISEVRIHHSHYLGLRFRRSLKVGLGPPDYFANGEHIAKRETKDSDTRESDTIFVKRSTISRFLDETKQTLLWCLRSQRYSERKPVEFGLENLGQPRFYGEGFHYVFERVELSDADEISRPRMAMMTQVFGKRIVDLSV